MKTKYLPLLSSVPSLLPLLTTLAFSTFLVACSPTVLLQDQFKSDLLDQKPIKDIPGKPTGDVVKYADHVAKRLTIVSLPGVASGKGLEFSSQRLVEGSFSTNYLSFKGTQAGDFTKPIKYSFTGKFDNFRDKFLVGITSDVTTEFGRFGVLEDGTLVVYTDFGAKDSGQKSLCKLQTDVIYLFSFRVDMVNGKTADGPKDGHIFVGILGEVTVDGEKKSSFNARESLLINPLKNGTGPLKPLIGFQWEAEGYPSKFTMSDVAISQ